MKRNVLTILGMALMLGACSEGNDPVVEQKPDSPAVEEPTADDPQSVIDEPLLYCEYTPISLTAEERAIADKLNILSWRLFRNALDQDAFQGNASISPASISIALSMAANGAANETLTSMLQAMGLQAGDLDALNSYNSKLAHMLTELDNTVSMDIANSIWHLSNCSLLKQFTDKTGDAYAAEVFSTTKDKMVGEINAWCKDKTNGLIEQIASQPSDVALVNAMYFKGNWTAKFDPAKTADAQFSCSDGSMSTVPFMNCVDEMLYGYADTHNAVIKSFGNGAYSMYILLPDEGKTIADCADFIVSSQSICNTYKNNNVTLSLPKFAVSNDIELSTMLKGMGFEQAFSSLADFSAMSETSLSLNSVDHAVNLTVDEGGAVAAAATHIGMVTSNCPEDDSVMNVNRPFIYAIVETGTHTPIIIGKIESL